MITEVNTKKVLDINKQRIALLIQYDGTSFLGWQRQKIGITVQAKLEEAIYSLDSSMPIKTFAAGRTDAGVHAAYQVVHFDYLGRIPYFRWPKALNGRLPASIRVLEASVQPPEWHACYSASFRRYRYMIYNGKNPNVFLGPWSWHRYKLILDEDLMNIALKSMVGFFDFSAFQRSGSYRANGFTTIQDVKLNRENDLIKVEIQASGFLYGMVRLIVGQLVVIGEHKLCLEDFEYRWKNCQRDQIKEAAPSKGLCLMRVGYPKKIFKIESFENCYPTFIS